MCNIYIYIYIYICMSFYIYLVAWMLISDHWFDTFFIREAQGTQSLQPDDRPRKTA